VLWPVGSVVEGKAHGDVYVSGDVRALVGDQDDIRGREVVVREKFDQSEMVGECDAWRCDLVDFTLSEYHLLINTADTSLVFIARGV